MRFIFLLLISMGILVHISAAFFRANQRGIPTVNMDSGDIEWVAVPREDDSFAGRSRCVFCRRGAYS